MKRFSPILSICAVLAILVVAWAATIEVPEAVGRTVIIGQSSPPSGGSNPNFTYVKSNSASDITVQLTGVTAGNLVVVFFSASYASPPTNITCSDGTSTLQKANTSNGTYQVGQWYYILASVASGDVTYTISNNEGTAAFTAVYEFSYTGTISLDQQSTNSGDGNGSITSGSVTTTGGTNSQLMMAGGGAYGGGGSLSAQSIAGTGGTGIIEGTGEAASSWYRIVTANTTGAGTMTDSGTGYWVAQLITFK